jgi:hypothetical protein
MCHRPISCGQIGLIVGRVYAGSSDMSLALVQAGMAWQFIGPSITGPAPADPCDGAERLDGWLLEDEGDPVIGSATLQDGVTALCDVPGGQLPSAPSRWCWDGMGRTSSRAGHQLGDAERRGARDPVVLAEMVHDAPDD